MFGLEWERLGSFINMDFKGWKLVVVIRMYEGKFKDLEKELEKKVYSIVVLYMFSLGIFFINWRN